MTPTHSEPTQGGAPAILLAMLLAACIALLALLLSALMSVAARADDRLLDIARTVWAESRGESPAGQIGVAYVVLNRAEQRGLPVSVIVRQRHQFTVWSGAARQRRLMALTDRVPGFIEAKAAAAIALARGTPDPTKGSTHFTSIHIRPPVWTRGMVPLRLGRHVFYRRTK